MTQNIAGFPRYQQGPYHTLPGGKNTVFKNKGIRDAGSTADFRILFEIFEILEI